MKPIATPAAGASGGVRDGDLRIRLWRGDRRGRGSAGYGRARPVRVQTEQRHPTLAPPAISYTGGTLTGAGGSVFVQSGTFHAVVFANVIPSAFGWALYPSGGARVSATVDDWRYVDGPTVTGTADLPNGSSMTVTDQ